jgi:hypothetical protein
VSWRWALTALVEVRTQRLFVVVLLRLSVVVVGAHRRSWLWALDMSSSSRCWSSVSCGVVWSREVVINGRHASRDDVWGASRQPPEGGRRCVVFVRCVVVEVVGLLTVFNINNNDVIVVVVVGLRCMVTMSLTATWPG